MMIRFVLTAWFTLFLTALLIGQEQASLKQRPGQLAVEDVATLVEAGLGEDVIIEKLRQNATAFDLSVDQLLELKKAGVTSEIIKAMMNPAAGTGGTAGSASTGAKDPNWPQEIPEELGIYTKVDGKVTQLEPEVVT